MVDPPAAAAHESSSRYRRTLEPDALSPVSTGGGNEGLFVDTAPSGCTEVSFHTRSPEAPLFDDCNNVVADVEDRDDTNSDHGWVPPNDLSALRLSIRDTRTTPSMPSSRRRRTGSASSAGSFHSGGKDRIKNNSNEDSPPLLLPLTTDTTTPKYRNGCNTSLASNSSSSFETGPHPNAQQSQSQQPHSSLSHSSRKAQRLSSKKKQRRGGNTLLNRLFCNSPLALGKDADDIFSENFPAAASSSSSAEENNNPLAFQARVQELAQDFGTDPKTIPSKDDDKDSCPGGLLRSAKEKLALYDEAKVRQSVQLNISETLLLACSEPSNDSPPSFQASSTEDSAGGESKKKNCQSLVGDATVGSTGVGGSSYRNSNSKWNSKNGSSSKKKSKKVSILDDAGSIQEPNTKLSMFDDDDDIAETASHPTSTVDSLSPDKPPLTEVVSKSKSREEKSKNRESGKPIKTSGGLVIPTPFTFSARKVYTSTLGACSPSTVPVEEEQQSPEPPRRKTPSRQWPPPPLPPGSNGSGDKDDPPEEEKEKQSRMDAYRDDSTASPLPLFRMTSSLEDLETVPEASSSKETETKASRTIESGDADDEDETAPLPNNLSSLTENDRKSSKSPAPPNLATNQDREGPVTSPLTITSSTGSDDPKQQEKKQSVSRRSESFRDLKAKYERKISEQKDQATMLNRLASQRLSEIEKLEGQISEKKVDEEKKVSELQVRMELLLREKKQEVERVRKEMEAKKEEELDHIRKEQESEVERLRKEMDALKEEVVQKKQVSSPCSPSHRVSHGELQRVKVELSDVKRELEAKEKELEKRSQTKSPVRASTGTDTLYRVTKELVEVKDKLTAKEKEIQDREDSAIERKRIEAELDRAKRELESKKKTEEDLERATSELAKVKEAMAATKENSSVISVPSEVEAELQRVKVDFSELTKKLVEKEKELEKTRKIVRPPPSPERQRSPIRPFPFPSPGRRRPCETPPKDRKDETDPLRKELDAVKEESEKAKQAYEQKIAELRVAKEVDLKRERDSFRKQKLVLDDKAARAKREHERAINELRSELEKQIQITKNAAEAQTNQQLSKQHDLEGVLAASCVREAKETGDLEKEIEQLRAEKTAAHSKVSLEEEKVRKLLEQIAALEKKHTHVVDDHHRSMEDLQTQNQKEMEELRAQVEKETTLRESQEEARIRTVAEANTAEKKELENKIVSLEFDLETARNGASFVDAKFGELEKRAEAEKQRHCEEVEMIRSKSHAEIERLKTELDDRTALEEAMQIATNERDAMQEKCQKLTAQLEETSSDHLENLKGLQGQLADTKAALDKAVEKNTQLEEESKNRLDAAEQDAANRCKELREQCESEVKELKERHVAERATFAAHLADSKAQLEALKKENDEKIKNLESELQEKEESCNKKIDEATKLSKGQENKLRSDYTKLKNEHAALERRMKEAEVNHNKQFEDLLSQLDLVEAEHRQALSAKDKTLSEKEAMVDDLGKQLENAQKAISDVEQRLISQMEDTEQEQHKTDALERKIEALNDELESMRESQKKFAREAAREKERACHNAREEMIEKAEAQFQQANDHYVKLRKQYDEAHDRAKKLEGELRLSKRKAEKLAREKDTCELDLNAEIAKLKSANAKIEADSAMRAKEYRRELERLLQTAKDFESKSEESERTSRTIQTTLATVVAEKDKLQKEYEEMKSVSEELMAIIEGHNGEQSSAL